MATEAGARTRALADFKHGKVRVLVATDIAARGLDIEQLPHVVNFELPHVPEDYVHRIGRTGRAGREGEAVSLVCVDENQLLRDIERLLNREIPQVLIAGYVPDVRAWQQPIFKQRRSHTAPGEGVRTRPGNGTGNGARDDDGKKSGRNGPPRRRPQARGDRRTISATAPPHGRAERRGEISPNPPPVVCRQSTGRRRWGRGVERVASQRRVRSRVLWPSSCGVTSVGSHLWGQILYCA